MNSILDARNPLMARAIGRALAWLPYCELSPKGISFNDGREFPVFWNRLAREYRAIVDYTVLAQIGKPYLVDFKQGQLVLNKTVGTLPELGDMDLYKFHIVYVAQETALGLMPMRLSNRYHESTFRRLYTEQANLGIIKGDPLWLHPYQFLGKDVCIAKLLEGMSYTDDNPEIIEAMRQDEDQIRLGIQASAGYNTPIVQEKRYAARAAV